MLLVGLTGGVASGKSLVANIFKDLGAYLLDADEIAHELIKSGTQAWKDIVDCFGSDILREDKEIDRGHLARIIFSDPDRRLELNAILHPRIFIEEERRRKAIAERDPSAIVVFVAPLLIECSAHELMDKVILVYADRNTQIKRLMERDKLSRMEAIKRIGSQMPLYKKKKYADYVINGMAPKEKIKEEVRQIYDELKEIAVISDPITQMP